MFEFSKNYQELHAYVMDVDRIPFAIMAIFLTLVVGVITGPRAGNAYPMLWIWIDTLLGSFGDRLDKKGRKKPDLMFRGFVVMSVAVLIAAFLGEVSKIISSEYDYWGITQAFLISLCLAGGGVWFVLLRLYFALEHKQMAEGAYFGVARTSRINLNSTDDFGITRVGIALAARSFDKGMVAPILWYLIGGFTALFVYAAVSGLAWRFGKDGFTSGFGAVPLAIEKLLGFIPSLFAALLMSLASIVTPTASIFKSFLSWFSSRTYYAQGGLPLTAMAWTLNVTLGGPVQDLNGSALKNAWTGPKNATAKNNHKHLRRALYINVVAHLLFVVALLGAYLWAGV